MKLSLLKAPNPEWVEVEISFGELTKVFLEEAGKKALPKNITAPSAHLTANGEWCFTVDKWPRGKPETYVLRKATEEEKVLYEKWLRLKEALKQFSEELQK